MAGFPKPMSEKQERYIRSLLDERDPGAYRDEVLKELDDTTVGVTSTRASQIITWLLGRPYSQAGQQAQAARPVNGRPGVPLPEVPDGRYAVRDGSTGMTFWRVDKPEDGKWAGWTFVKEQQGPRFERVRGKEMVDALESIVAAGVKESAILYGIETGCCSVCGCDLTSKWRTVGVGPTCAKKRGWTFDALAGSAA